MNVFQPWQLLLVSLAGWINRQQQDVVAYIQEENRILKSKLKGKRIRFSDDERRRLAVKGKVLGGQRVITRTWCAELEILIPQNFKPPGRGIQSPSPL